MSFLWRTRARKIVPVVAVLATLFWLWKVVLEARVIPKRWGVVEEGRIYRSGQLSQALVEGTLRSHGIRVIVDLRIDGPGHDEDAEKAAAAALGIEIRRFPLAGNGTGDIANYAGAIAAMVEARRDGLPVLVHCAAGAQRTGGVVACYRMLVEGSPASSALEEMKRYGWKPEKDQVLVKYINSNIEVLGAMLVERRVIAAVPDPLPQLPEPEKSNVQVPLVR